MQFSLITLLSLSALSIATPVSSPDALAEAFAHPEPSPAEIFARATKTKACCPRNRQSGCVSVPASSNCPASQPEQYSECSGLGQLGLVNLLLCDILSGNTLNVPVTVSLLNQ